MSKNVYIAATEARSGKSAVALGLMELLLKNVRRVGFFRPIIDAVEEPGERDNDVELICKHFNLSIPYADTFAYTQPEAQALIHYNRMPDLIDGILEKFEEISRKYDFVVCEGTDFEGAASVLEYDINAVLASNLNCPVLLVGNGNHEDPETVVRSSQLAIQAFEEKGCTILGVILNRVVAQEPAELIRSLREVVKRPDLMVFAIPENETLRNPLMSEVVRGLKAQVLYGQDMLGRQVHSYTIAASRVVKFLADLEDGTLTITPGDRVDILVSLLLAVASGQYPNLAGVVLTDGLKPEPPVERLLRSLDTLVPILCVPEDTYTTARRLGGIHPRISAGFERKIATALRLFEQHVDGEALFRQLRAARSTHITPKMFEYMLLQRAKEPKQHIVLPEGNEERILRAAEILLHRNVVDITLLGDEKEIRELIARLGLRLEAAQIVNPARSPLLEDYARTYYELRKHKGVTLESALETMTDVSYYGTMMVYKGHADGMVSGAVHTTQHTIRPALEFIKTKPGVSIVSSVFFMCLKDRVLVYGDCAVNPNPTAEQLADIAIASAETARTFGIEPLVAMLSYSTGTSGQGEEVEKVRRATQIARQKAPHLKIEGPMQYDAAVDIEVARTKKIQSEVAGRATVFIFPDLNTGNNTYKAVQRSAGAVAIGPVLQGLRKPVNDLSRGCTVTDIVNTVAITAIQAQAEKQAASITAGTAPN